MREIYSPKLSDYTTIRLGGKAIAMLFPECLDDIALVYDRARCLGGKTLVIGRGSNLLACGGELPLVCVNLCCFDGLEVVGENGSEVFVKAGAGVPLPRLLRFCLANGLGGLEGLAGIPGNVGGGCAMNAGSFGVEIADRLSALEVWSNGEASLVGRDRVDASYRQLSIAPPASESLILSAIFALTKAEKGVIFRAMNLNYIEKKTRQPLGFWSAGCAFKNPASGKSAGLLLDMAGFRGYGRGGMLFSEKHANFLINEGSGTPVAALDLLEEAREAVLRETGVDLQLEIKIIS